MGLFDRLFGQDRQKEQTDNVAELHIDPENNLEEDKKISEEVSPVETLEQKEELEAQKQRTLDMMAQYYAAKEAAAERVKEAKEKGIDPLEWGKPGR